MAKLTLPSAMLSTAAASVAEGAGAINLTVTLSTVQTYTATVSYITSDGTATAGSDYTAASGTLTFAPGITSQVIAVPIIDDSSDEPNETFTVALNSPSNAILGTPSSTTVTITDDDSAPTLSWQAGNFNAGEAAGSGLATVLLSAASSFTVTVNYASSDGSATLTPPPPDYTAKSGTLTFAPSQTSQSVSITILDDTLAESNETINLTLSSPTNATLGTASATMTIVDDDGGAQPSEEFYTYDAIGNLLSKTGVGTYTNGANGNGTGAGPHRIKQINGGAAFVYDPNGNLSNGGGASYTWDYENRPLTIATSSGSESYAYDADGERVKVVAGSTTTVYLGGLWEETSAGAVKSYYTFGGQIVAMRDSAEPTDPVSYLHGDHLGSVSVASGAGASNKGSQRFDPWGKLLSGGITQTRKNYTGQYLDTTGLLYYHARYYDPTIARFVSADSVVPGSASGSMDGVQLRPLMVDFHEPGFAGQIGSENGQPFWFQMNDKQRQKAGSPWGPTNPQALNRYSYVQNNPLWSTDPSGHLALNRERALILQELLETHGGVLDTLEAQRNREKLGIGLLGGLFAGAISGGVGAALGATTAVAEIVGGGVGALAGVTTFLAGIPDILHLDLNGTQQALAFFKELDTQLRLFIESTPVTSGGYSPTIDISVEAHPARGCTAFCNAAPHNDYAAHIVWGGREHTPIKIPWEVYKYWKALDRPLGPTR